MLLAPPAGFAQVEVIPADPVAASIPVSVDPPARVGRVAALSGTVSYHLAQADRWEPATLNLPVTTGSAFWTEPGGTATLEVAGTRAVLDSGTELEFVRLDDAAMVATLSQGRMYVRVRGLVAGDQMEVRTPRGVVMLRRAGRYVVAAGSTTEATTVGVVEGEASVEGGGPSVVVGPNQVARVTGNSQAGNSQAGNGQAGNSQAGGLAATLGPLVRDAFLVAALSEERPLVQRPSSLGGAGPAAAPASVAGMTGGEAVLDSGAWTQTPEYGAVWVPPVDPGWVPYREGRWAYVQPWGWTWVDDAPWGFAPTHYGRWVETGSRWCWAPGLAPVAVYAPAVVAFLPVVAGSLSWVPLGWREPFYPSYAASAVYVRNINVTHVTNVTTVVNSYVSQVKTPGWVRTGLVNGHAGTVAPVSAMVGSQRLLGVARGWPGGERGLSAGLGAPVRPTLATMGVTPSVARQLQLPAGEVLRPAGPGPVARFAAAGGGGTGGGATGVDGTVAGGTGVVGAGAALAGGVAGMAAAQAGRVVVGRPGAVGGAGGGGAGLPALVPSGPVGGFRPNGGAPGPVFPASIPGGRPGGGAGLPGGSVSGAGAAAGVPMGVVRPRPGAGDLPAAGAVGPGLAGPGSMGPGRSVEGVGPAGLPAVGGPGGCGHRAPLLRRQDCRPCRASGVRRGRDRSRAPRWAWQRVCRRGG